MSESESERRERQTGDTARQTGKRSEFCLFSFRETGSDLIAGWPIIGGSGKLWTNQISSVRGFSLMLQFNSGTV